MHRTVCYHRNTNRYIQLDAGQHLRAPDAVAMDDLSSVETPPPIPERWRKIVGIKEEHLRLALQILCLSQVEIKLLFRNEFENDDLTN